MIKCVIRVLVVDASECYARLLKLNLERTGRCEVRTVTWSASARTAALEFKPQVVLLDVIMPGMYGGDVAKQFKADPELKDTPIIFHSTSIKSPRAGESRWFIGSYGFVAKPANIATIIAAIEIQAKIPDPVL